MDGMTRCMVVVASCLSLVSQSYGAGDESPYDGSWTGKLSNASEISFTIQDNRLTSVDYSLGVKDGRDKLAVAVHQVFVLKSAPAIKNKKVTSTMNGTIKIEFTSPTKASGSVQPAGKNSPP
jgi:hypothetical protein